MLRNLDSREDILVDLASDGEQFTPEVIEKYRLAGAICNGAVRSVVQKAGERGATLSQLCMTGDEYIASELAKVFNQGQVEKGPAFPACVSPNECCENFSPLTTEDTQIAAGDMLKISLGVQIDGYIAYAGHTIVVGNTDNDMDTSSDDPDSKGTVSGRKADVMAAVRDAAVVIGTLLRPGVKSATLTRALDVVAAEYNCNALKGTLCSSMKRFVPSGRKQFGCSATHSDPDTPPMKDFVVVDGEVYDVNIVMSTGSGDAAVGDARTTVFRRNLATSYQLRAKTSRAVYSDISARFPTLPFSLRQLRSVRDLLGVKECVTRSLLIPFDPRFEKRGEFVAQYRFTAIVHNGKTICLADAAVQDVASAHSIGHARLQKLLATNPRKPAAKSSWSTNEDLADAL